MTTNNSKICFLCKKEVVTKWPSKEAFVYMAFQIGETKYSQLTFCFDCFEASAGWDFVVPLVEPVIERFAKEKATNRQDYDALLALENKLDEYYKSKRKI